MTLLVVFVFGISILFRKMRTGWTAVTALTLPFGIYTILAYWNTYRIRIVVILLCACVISVLLGISIMKQEIRSRKNVKNMLKVRRLFCAAAVGKVFSLAMLALMIPLAVTGLIGPTNIIKEKQAIKQAEGKDALEANVDTVLKITGEEWQS